MAVFQGKVRILSIPPTYFFACLLFNLLMLYGQPVTPSVASVLAYIGVVLLVAGGVLSFLPYVLFKKHGTPETYRASTCVVTTGVFRYSRNPMYVGFVVTLLGVACLVGRIAGFLSPLILFFILNWMFIPYEEEKMEQECGQHYLDYKKTVRRWL